LLDGAIDLTLFTMLDDAAGSLLERMAGGSMARLGRVRRRRSS